MFASFFPRYRLLFTSALLWACLCIAGWYAGGRDLGSVLSLGWLIGFHYVPPPLQAASPAEQSANAMAVARAADIWLDQYIAVAGAIFVGFWSVFSPQRWFRWSVIASSVILFIVWLQVQLDLMITDWFRSFYDLIQKALSAPGAVTTGQYIGQLLTYFYIAMTYVILAVGNAFLVSHFVFRWRTAMNDYYTENWEKLRHIEGASQRVQEDTMRFAQNMETLGVSLINSVMTLIAFLPLLWGLSRYVKDLPILGEVPQALVVVAVGWSVLGTGALALAGIRLPALTFMNQRVEAAYRKELVHGEDDDKRAQPASLVKLFDNVRRNYFRIYLSYLYFNVVRYGYLQAGVLVPYVALTPTIVTAGFTLGVMQQIIQAFSRVTTSFQYLVNSWTTIVELLSIYKRLNAFEATLRDVGLDPIEHHPIERYLTPRRPEQREGAKG